MFVHSVFATTCVSAFCVSQVCHHAFVVEFIGFVPSKLAVVTRFMANGSLQHLLYTSKKALAPPVTGISAPSLTELPKEYRSIAREVCGEKGHMFRQ